MDKKFRRKLIAGAVAVLITASSVPIVSLNTIADESNAGSAANAQPQYDGNSYLDQFDKNNTDDYELYINFNGETAAQPYVLEKNGTLDETIISKYGKIGNRVVGDVTCAIDGGRFKFNYNLDPTANNRQADGTEYKSWSGWSDYGNRDEVRNRYEHVRDTHCGFLHEKYDSTSRPNFENYDGIEFEITGDGSKNTFVIQIGNIVDLNNDNANTRYRFPIYLGFTGTKTVRIPFDVLRQTAYSADGLDLGNVNRFSFYMNKGFVYEGFFDDEDIENVEKGFIDVEKFFDVAKAAIDEQDSNPVVDDRKNPYWLDKNEWNKWYNNKAGAWFNDLYTGEYAKGSGVLSDGHGTYDESKKVAMKATTMGGYDEDTGILNSSVASYKGTIYIDNVRLYTHDDAKIYNEDGGRGFYIDDAENTVISYDGKSSDNPGAKIGGDSLSVKINGVDQLGALKFDVSLQRKITSVTIVRTDGKQAPHTVGGTVQFKQDRLNSNVVIERTDLDNAIKALCDGDYKLVFKFAEATNTGLGKVGGEVEEIPFSVKNNDVHHYTSDWTTDDDYHWHKCTCAGHDDTSTKDKHNWGTPTISADGTKHTATCVDCGVKKEDELHKYVLVGDPDKPVKLGATVDVECGVCKAPSSFVVPDDKTKITVPAETRPTCETDGVGTYTDPVTGVTVKVIIPAIGHDFENAKWDVIDKPDYNTPGKAEQSGNNDPTHKNTIVLPALNDDDYKTTTKEPTCTKEGSKTYKYYIDGEEIFSVTKPIPKKDHEWGNWVMTTPPKYNVDGEAERECEKCGKTETKPIPMLSDDTAWRPIPEKHKEPTVDEHGSDEYEYIGGNEGYPNITQDIEKIGHEHDYEGQPWKVSKVPTAETEGQAYRDCKNDGDGGISGIKQTVVLPKLSDEKSWKSLKLPDCDNDGVGVFHDTATDTDVTVTFKKTGHAYDYSKPTVTAAPTETAKGKAEYKCAKDENHVISIELPPLSEADKWELNAPTCTKDGSAVYYDKDNDSEILVNLSATGHAWEEFKLNDPSDVNTEITVDLVCKNDPAHTRKVSLSKLSDSTVWDKDTTRGPDANGKYHDKYTLKDPGSFGLPTDKPITITLEVPKPSSSNSGTSRPGSSSRPSTRPSTTTNPSTTTEPSTPSQPIAPPQPVEIIEPVETEEPVETAEPIETAETIETAEPVETEESVETTEPIETAETIETSESTEAPETDTAPEPELSESENTDAANPHTGITTFAIPALISTIAMALAAKRKEDK